MPFLSSLTHKFRSKPLTPEVANTLSACPVDLYKLILDFLDPEDKPTLLSLVLVSKSWNAEALPQLYRTMTSEDILQQISFLKPIDRSERHALLVRNYAFTSSFSLSTKRRSIFSSHRPVNLNLGQLVPTTIPKMKNLISLKFNPVGPDPLRYPLLRVWSFPPSQEFPLVHSAPTRRSKRRGHIQLPRSASKDTVSLDFMETDQARSLQCTPRA
ncbi:hypothetical protein BDN72DRAFT_849607 [Pluteus cervinus]|uniref:Uncharacterized protein n=1 Tax=Pluteus cervinus TaxID=181527 RepID=A0ACD3A6J9_9AGAR|nr:hypothetical protein BDN72DRAFT_849607 [Pluteus cervinus]